MSSVLRRSSHHPPSPARLSLPRSAQPQVRRLVEGQVLCREGDPPGPLYVICSGLVRAYRRSLTTPDSIEELAQLGPGDVVGELAPILRQTRSATVQAVQPTDVLEVPVEHLALLAQRHESLQRVIAYALKDRAGLSHSEIEARANHGGVHLLPDVFAADRSTESGPKLPVPPHDPAVAYPKALVCPACGAQFSTLVIHARKDQPAERSTDFHQRYLTPFNPYDYELFVCPNDLYAALPADFGDLSAVQRASVPEVVGLVIGEWE